MSKSSSGLFNGTKGHSLQERIIPGKPGTVTGGSSTKLGKNMMREMGVKGKAKWGGYQAQHIIPAEMSKHPVLQKIGIDLDNATNGIFLRSPDKGISTGSRHRGYHSVYSEFVKQRLNEINISADSISIQRQVRNLQTSLRRMQESGLPLYSSEGATVEQLNCGTGFTKKLHTEVKLICMT